MLWLTVTESTIFKQVFWEVSCVSCCLPPVRNKLAPTFHPGSGAIFQDLAWAPISDLVTNELRKMHRRNKRDGLFCLIEIRVLDARLPVVTAYMDDRIRSILIDFNLFLKMWHSSLSSVVVRWLLFRVSGTCLPCFRSPLRRSLHCCMLLYVSFLLRQVEKQRTTTAVHKTDTQIELQWAVLLLKHHDWSWLNHRCCCCCFSV